jgi:diguanylate cyclase (GGDEF)-like protein
MVNDTAPVSSLKQSGHRRKRNRRIVQFILLAILGDVGLIGIELAMGLNPITDITQRPFLYIYVFSVTIAAFGVFGAMVGSREDLLEEMALRDSLTGLFNARYLQMRMKEELAAAKRYRTPVSFVLFDIDHFKRINDDFGHPVGDRVLQQVGQLIQSELREGEIAARVGGEEFALLLPHTSAINAANGTERILKTIGQTAFETDDSNKLTVTVSAGVVCTRDHGTHSAESIYHIADQALYEAKESGRNKAVIA